MNISIMRDFGKKLLFFDTQTYGFYGKIRNEIGIMYFCI